MIDPRSLAEELTRHIGDSEVIDLRQLSQNPPIALEEDSSVRIVWVDPNELPSGCSMAAAYDRNSKPARLLVSRDASPGRRRFSVLHEYAHHLRNQVPAVMEALFKARRGGSELEERMCDEFASIVLMPEPLLVQMLGQRVTASAVLELIAAAPASAEACAVAAARRLPAPGYVMLLAPDGTANFTAHHADVYYVRRDVRQQGLLTRAASGLPVRGREQVRYATGNLSREMFLDAATDRRTVAVLVTDSPPWGGFTAGIKRGPEGFTGQCKNCDRQFTTFASSCRSCGQPPCPECGQCDCPTAQGALSDRQCDTCFLMHPAAAYAAGSTTCNECS